MDHDPEFTEPPPKDLLSRILESSVTVAIVGWAIAAIVVIGVASGAKLLASRMATAHVVASGRASARSYSVVRAPIVRKHTPAEKAAHIREYNRLKAEQDRHKVTVPADGLLTAENARKLADEADARANDIAPYVTTTLDAIGYFARLDGRRELQYATLRKHPAEMRARFVKALEARGFTVGDADEKRYGKGCLVIRW